MRTALSSFKSSSIRPLASRVEGRRRSNQPCRDVRRRHTASVNVLDVDHYRDRMNQANWAEELARKHLEAPLPRRWAHVQGVAARARVLAPILSDDADLLEAAAWLHDIGYSPELAETGFHPLDGARYLRDAHFADPVLCSLVAHHSCAVIEAEERGLASELRREFPAASMVLNDALAYCDMTTDPSGNMVSVHDRLAEIRERYGPHSIVTRFTHNAEPCLIASVKRTNCRLLPSAT